MTNGALYHDFDPFKCAVMREAIRAKAIADGEVICGDIKELDARQLMGFTQCHFFAGGGFWSLALRRAGWADDRPVWTGSCPCPSFSAAGKGGGFADPRHLWPEWHRLIRQCRPAVLFGEQVDGAIGHGWLDLVGMDLEGEDYALGAAVLPAAGAGAPHKRNRLYFCAHAKGYRLNLKLREPGEPKEAEKQFGYQSADLRGTGQRADTQRAQRGPEPCGGPDIPNRDERGGGQAAGGFTDGREAFDGSDAEQLRLRRGRIANGGGQEGGGLNEAERGGVFQPTAAPGNAGIGHQPLGARLEGHFGDVREWRGPGWLDPLEARSVAETGATGGFWADCDWWYGRDGKYRPIGPGLQPLAHGSPARVGRLRMYGDAICVEAARLFIESYIEARRGN